MKKVLLSAALGLAAAGSWAFYPKAADQLGYMMVIGRFSGSGFAQPGELLVVSPDGQVAAQPFATKNIRRPLYQPFT
jgi:hypothetical protein